MTVWWELAKPTSLQAGVPSVTSAAAGNVSNPLHTHTNTNTGDVTSSLSSDHNKQLSHVASLGG